MLPYLQISDSISIDEELISTTSIGDCVLSDYSCIAVKILLVKYNDFPQCGEL